MNDIENRTAASGQEDSKKLANKTQILPIQQSHRKKSSIVLKIRLMKPNTMSESFIDSKSRIIKDTPNAIFLYENDFIEIDIPENELTMRGFIGIALTELQIQHHNILDSKDVYIRKLPNTRLRRDVEISRLKEFEEIEIAILNNCDNNEDSCSNRKRNCTEGIENNEK